MVVVEDETHDNAVSVTLLLYLIRVPSVWRVSCVCLWRRSGFVIKQVGGVMWNLFLFLFFYFWEFGSVMQCVTLAFIKRSCSLFILGSQLFICCWWMNDEALVRVEECMPCSAIIRD